jgi:hypothetical protein
MAKTQAGRDTTVPCTISAEASELTASLPTIVCVCMLTMNTEQQGALFTAPHPTRSPYFRKCDGGHALFSEVMGGRNVTHTSTLLLHGLPSQCQA